MNRESARQRIHSEILAEWRGCEEPADLDRGISSAARFVQAILKAAGASEGIEEQEFQDAWKEIAGDFLAAHTQPLSVKGGHLMLRVTQPAMRFHLEQMKPDLLKKFQQRLGARKVRSVKFVLG